MRVLTVCLGNICRSPTAEVVIKTLRPDWDLDSCGTAGWHVGNPPYGPMQTAAKARGYDLSKLRARQFTAADFAAFDLILAMDGENLAHIEAMRPKGKSAKCVLFGAFGPGGDVPDPYYTRDFEGCLDMIEACADGLSRRYPAMHR